MLVTIITPTGARQEAFSRAEYYMKRQTYQGAIQWIVVDDCDPPTKCTMPEIQTYVRGPKLWRPGINTQRPNMDVALPLVKGDFIFVWEDDDAVMPTYLEHMLRLLRFYPAVGEGNAAYYNIHTRQWREWSNYKHCSLCQTGIRKELMPRLEEAVNSGELFMDCALWRIFNDHKVKPFLFAGQNYVVGIKGMPGRFGIGAGHQPDKNFQSDPGWHKLKELVGKEDAQFYKNVANREAKVLNTKKVETMMPAIKKVLVRTPTTPANPVLEKIPNAK